jgi:hypothetical protein
MDGLPDDGLRLSSQSAGIGGYGYRLVMLVDPCNNEWMSATVNYSWKNSVAQVYRSALKKAAAWKPLPPAPSSGPSI